MARKPQAKQIKQEVDLLAIMNRFGDEEKCRAYLEALRWPEGVKCLRCESDKISRIHTRGLFTCDACGYQFSVKVGTIFHDSHLPLTKWFLAVYLMSEAKKGVSALQLKRTLSVAYKTAWYLCHRIRAAVADADTSPLVGTVKWTRLSSAARRRTCTRTASERLRGAAALARLWFSLPSSAAGAFASSSKTGATARRCTPSSRAKSAPTPSAPICTDEWEAYQGCGDPTRSTRL